VLFIGTQFSNLYTLMNGCQALTNAALVLVPMEGEVDTYTRALIFRNGCQALTNAAPVLVPMEGEVDARQGCRGGGGAEEQDETAALCLTKFQTVALGLQGAAMGD